VASTRDRLTERAGDMKPYVERAFTDEKVRNDVRDAIAAAREIYDELIGNRGVTTIASRVASDKDIQDSLRQAIDNLRSAADRVQGAKDGHTARNVVFLTGIVVGVLFNPVTGPATREWLKGLVGGGESADFGDPSSNNGS
jgi:hypothetical protein